MRVRALLLAMVVTGTLGTLSACAGAPAQIVDYAPVRNALDVSTTAPVRITFDHAVDQASVASRLHLSPAVVGVIHWLGPRSLEYDHSPLRTSTIYEVILEAGYSDAAGNVYVLRHHWSFTTEAPPAFAASSPSDGSTRINTADFLTVDFTRAMSVESLRGAISFNPDVAFTVHPDPTDDRRAVIAPDSLLDAQTTYTLMISTAATDVDGNQLDRGHSLRFTTGDVGALHHWIAFATLSATGGTGGLWIVNETGFPRQLLGSGIIQSFDWSPDGTRLVFQSDSGDWSLYAPGSEPQPLDFSGSWAGSLAGDAGYAYLDTAGVLHREAPSGATETIAVGVSEAVVSPDGLRLAYTQPRTDGTTLIWGYDVGLRSHYVLADEKGDVGNLAWAPDGARLAYLRQGQTSATLRVLGLTGSASITSIASGQDLGRPAWLRDSVHVVIDALVQSASGPARKAFVINVAAPPPSLTLALGLPADPTVNDVSNPVPSPDGHQIAFISGNQVWLMNADGTRPTPLTRYDSDSFPYSCLMPAWTRS